MPSEPFDTVIIGGGVIGLGIAEALGRRGRRVCVLEANRATSEASWAAAGMLAPHNEADAPDDLWRLGSASLARWPGFLAAAGIGAAAVDYRERGSLIPVLDAEDAQSVERRQAWLTAAGICAQWWDRDTLHAAEPQMTTAVGALWVPGGQVNPRLLARHLRERCDRQRVQVRFHQPVAEVTGEGVLLDSGEHVAARRIVIAAGAWSTDLGAMIGLDLEGEPIKGQMVRFAAPAERLLTHFVHCAHAYCVPRYEGGIVVGATMSQAGFDRTQDDTAIAGLVAGARRVLPHLGDFEVAESWTGLRPRLADGGPLMDAVDERCLVATGHFRNGILLLPITIATMVARICEEAVPVEAEPFGMRDGILVGSPHTPLP
jgi:glycine oxidase